ncbi:MAG: hypothetical protein KDA20_03785 [Phycisphaerales bacterium]|nr:hypothetical protein [Phycisphaerales bacterium]
MNRAMHFGAAAAFLLGGAFLTGAAAQTTDDVIDELESALLDQAGDVSPKQLRKDLKHLEPLTDADFPAPNAAKEELGKLLFFDKVLSGNMNISCATCHHPLTATGDGLSLSIGEGGRGLGVIRDTGTADDAVHERVPRNAPPVFMLGHKDFTVMFHDGRVSGDAVNGFVSPAGSDLPSGLDNALAVQAMFPVTSGTEMAGQGGENDIADHGADLPAIWESLAQRLRDIPEYVDLFKAAYSDVNNANDITYVHAANAIAAFEGTAWRADNSPFDQWLRGDNRAMTRDALRGAKLFYGKANCASCHSGVLQTDLDFHAIGIPQIGPGKGDNAPGFSDGHDDFGRERVTGNPEDRCRFRTPTLRNVALTGPWGHDGAYDSLEAVVRHHLDPIRSLYYYEAGQMVLPSRTDLDAIDLTVFSSDDRMYALASTCEITPVSLSDDEVAQVIEFLRALTDPTQIDLRRNVPKSVPSGLPMFE